MSNNLNYLHSHSGLERTLKDKDLNSKAFVLIDEKYKDMFDEISMLLKEFTYGGRTYYKVPILAFVRKGGVFKNLNF